MLKISGSGNAIRLIARKQVMPIFGTLMMMQEVNGDGPTLPLQNPTLMDTMKSPVHTATFSSRGQTDIGASLKQLFANWKPIIAFGGARRVEHSHSANDSKPSLVSLSQLQFGSTRKSGITEKLNWKLRSSLEEMIFSLHPSLNVSSNGFFESRPIQETGSLTHSQVRARQEP